MQRLAELFVVAAVALGVQSGKREIRVSKTIQASLRARRDPLPFEILDQGQALA